MIKSTLPLLHVLLGQFLLYKAITFDLDDTLWPVAPAIQAAEQALIEYLFSRAPAASQLLTNTQHIRLIRARLLAQEPQLAIDLATMRKRLIQEVLVQTQGDLGLVNPAFDVFFEMRNKVHFYADTLHALARLSGRFPLFAISNGNADLQRVGLAAFFKGGVSAAHLGIAKPDPRIFLHALSILELSPTEVLHLGDDVHLDVLAAQNVGLDAVWVNRTLASWPLADPPQLQVPDLLVLCDWLGC
jgi:HAD superfamily hydrolase (TIGR01549 family)